MNASSSYETTRDAFPRKVVYIVSKRCLDVVASALALLALSPLLLGIYLLQCITTKGSAFFQQERIGLGGKPFHILKFRTMKEDAEENGPRLTNKQDASKFTPLGQFLRKHHLDELPQLWNVLIGDMSIVGYRPERQYFIDIILQHDNRYALLYQMRPGITS
ncbi:MAG: sugar transferase, partial [Bacteroidaceae bacterium]|nr:sugar transferase [Bacteroidaceae bacterium]